MLVIYDVMARQGLITVRHVRRPVELTYVLLEVYLREANVACCKHTKWLCYLIRFHRRKISRQTFALISRIYNVSTSSLDFICYLLEMVIEQVELITSSSAFYRSVFLTLAINCTLCIDFQKGISRKEKHKPHMHFLKITSTM